MKIGILTFHWSANHGAVLQTFATQEYLKKNHLSEVEVINYYPKKFEYSLLKALYTRKLRLIPSRIKELIKNNRINKFRSNLNLTKRYYSSRQLFGHPTNYDIIFCGSDQIWNPNYVLHGEQGPTAVYFLDFAKKKTKKASLSASFGCTEYPENVKKIIKPYVEKLDFISVREKTGINILEKMGINNAVHTADPTSLLSREEYLELCSGISNKNSSYVALCILRKQARKNKELIKNILSLCNVKTVNIKNKSMEKWLSGMRDAKMVVTNSFHCVMMCLKLHKPFVVITETGALAGMNDRLFSLLEHFNLEGCIISDLEQVDKIKDIQFDWLKIDEDMNSYADTLKTYLNQVIGG